MGRVRRHPFHLESHAPQPSTRVLLVDDDPHTIKRYQDALTHFGADVTSAASVPAALRELERGGFDLVLVDYLLHGFRGPTGLEVAAAARAAAVAPVYLMALHPKHVPAGALLAAGVTGILDKAYLSREHLEQLLLDIQFGVEAPSGSSNLPLANSRQQ